MKIHITNLTSSLLGNHPLFPKLPDGSRDLDHSTTHIDTWKSMEKLLNTGKAKAIGVANYSVKYLDDLLPHATVTPAVNQIENHPYLPQQEIVDYCRAKGIHVTAYSPFGSTGSPMMKEEGVLEVAQKHGVEPGTVLLSYHSEFPQIPFTFHLHSLPGLFWVRANFLGQSPVVPLSWRNP